MRNRKKTPTKKAQTRHEQNQRAAAKKAAQGLTRISLWIPKNALEAAEKRELTRIGVVFGFNPEEKIVLMKDAEGKITSLPYEKSLFES